MPGNREIYEQAMREGANAAWEQQWDRAIAAYGRAVMEFPEDPAAHNSLGLALLQAGRLEDALKVYTRASQLAPDDPAPLERAADVLERMGRLREAAKKYVAVAEIYLAQRDVARAIGNWERASRLSPGMLDVHSRLALAYERTGQKKAAVREYLVIAAIFQRAGDTKKAIQACQRALRLAPNNPHVLNSLQALQSGALVRPPEEETPTVKTQAQKREPVVQEQEEEVSQAELKGPIGEAQETALVELATYLFESGIATTDKGLYVSQAIDLQRRGENEDAIQAYKDALKARVTHPGVYLNLGALLVEEGEYREAIKYLEEVTDHPDFAAGAHFALGQAYLGMGRHRKAAYHLLTSLRMVDMSMAMGDEVNQLDSIYGSMLASIEALDESQLAVINDKLVTFMTGKNWKQSVAETRRQLEDAARMDGASGLVDVLVTEGASKITESLNLIQQYRQRRLYTLALEEAHYALQFAPNYLPLHLRIADILMEERRVEDAVNKYNLVAYTYYVRGDVERATQILEETLRNAPMEIETRRQLINILEEQERWEEALRQYISLADTYYQLADFDTARDTYEEAQRLGQKVGADRKQMIHIMHRIADIDIQRLDLKKAMRTCQQIRDMDPTDERARLTLIDLHYRLGNQSEAIKELDGLLKLYATQKRVDLIVKVLEEQVALRPNDMALRSRLARVYQQLGRISEAVEQLDALGELQLEAGLQEAAAITIRQIVALNPPDVEGYRALLEQLGG